MKIIAIIKVAGEEHTRIEMPVSGTGADGKPYHDAMDEIRCTDTDLFDRVTTVFTVEH
jgi:hypothetical protein